MARRQQPKLVRTFEEAREAYVQETELALDLETGGFSPFRDPIHVITLYGPVSGTIAILHYPRGQAIPKEVLSWLSEFPEIVTHNGVQFDLLFLAQAGMAWEKPILYDTMIGELSIKVADRRDVRVNLQDTVKRRLGQEVDKTIDHGRWGDPELDENQIAYCMGDIAHIIDLKRAQLKEASKIDKEGDIDSRKECIEFEMRLAKAVVQMELNGLPVNLQAVQEFFDSRHEHHQEVETFLFEHLGCINLNSWQQIIKAFKENLSFTLPNTQADTLLGFTRGEGTIAEACQALLDWKEYRQRASMFGPEWRSNYVVIRDGVARVHGRFWQVGTNTGRMSSTNPNLQQIPRNMRSAFGGYEGLAIGKTDYKAIEVRVAAAMSNDAAMLEAINAGEDIHTFVAATAFGIPAGEVTKRQRQIAKAISFTLIFGGSFDTAYAYAKANGSEVTLEEMREGCQRFLVRFEGIQMSRNQAEYVAHTLEQKTLTYPTGLRRQIRGPELRSTVLLNNLIQGVAAAGIKKSALLAYQRGLGPYISALVHDEMVYAAPVSDIEAVRREIDQAMLDGMAWALQDTPSVSIGVESTWGMNWSGNPENEQTRESGVAA